MAAPKSMQEAVASVQADIEARCDWVTSELIVDVAVSLKDVKLVPLNLVSTFGSRTRVSKKQRLTGQLNWHWLLLMSTSSPLASSTTRGLKL
jgi:hypothetical protein